MMKVFCLSIDSICLAAVQCEEDCLFCQGQLVELTNGSAYALPEEASSIKSGNDELDCAHVTILNRYSTVYRNVLWRARGVGHSSFPSHFSFPVRRTGMEYQLGEGKIDKNSPKNERLKTLGFHISRASGKPFVFSLLAHSNCRNAVKSNHHTHFSFMRSLR